MQFKLPLEYVKTVTSSTLTIAVLSYYYQYFHSAISGYTASVDTPLLQCKHNISETPLQWKH